MSVAYDTRVIKQIATLSKKDKAKIINVVDLFEKHGFAVTALFLKKLSHNLWELRADRWRLLFGLIHGSPKVIHIFYKQTQKTPKQELMIAIKRLKEEL